MARLSREYLRNHAPSDIEPGDRLVETPEAFGEEVINQVLKAAEEQLTSEEDERDEIELSLPVRLRPVVNAPMGGCVEVQIGVPPFVFRYHQEFKGKRPGKG
ncbi:hypothetical protein [Streptomyces hydrogenans]|uniref:Uncharacterized protein n=1 Tax=Streptomyces hydrogenans TaxID=1873719 RepID=A0ABQ3PJI0_9ACTN|nr:hypothetical protein [Streptomyces hydrogenans]GHG10174.1 hypothetical protein GCM10018784_23600 [Streptomyces hydrogenans]GHI25188.1 hypothetical protein Shyd_65590 [Streptomyces hydrogenans]